MLKQITRALFFTTIFSACHLASSDLVELSLKTDGETYKLDTSNICWIPSKVFDPKDYYGKYYLQATDVNQKPYQLAVVLLSKPNKQIVTHITLHEQGAIKQFPDGIIFPNPRNAYRVIDGAKAEAIHGIINHLYKLKIKEEQEAQEKREWDETQRRLGLGKKN